MPDTATVVLTGPDNIPVTLFGVGTVRLNTPNGGTPADFTLGSGGGGSAVLNSILDGSATRITRADLSGLTAFRDYAFYQAENLEQIGIPDTVTDIGAYAFYGCTALEWLLSSTGEKANELTSVETVGVHAFEGCTSFECDIYLPAVVTIGEKAFANNPVGLSFAVGPYCTSIGSKAFENAGFQYFAIEATTPPTLTAADIFNTDTLEQIEVPHGYLSVYQNAQYWSAYASLMIEDSQ